MATNTGGSALARSRKTTSKESPLRGLPTELVLEIIQIACASSPASARAISMTCSWARAIALPYAFATVILGSTPLDNKRTRRGAEAPQAPRFPRHLGPLVQSLWIDPGPNRDTKQLQSVFDACRKASRLALSYDHWLVLTQSTYLWPHEPADPVPDADDSGVCSHYPPGHLKSPCRSLTVNGPWLHFMWRESGWKNRVGCSIFAGLTHLRLLVFEPREIPTSHMPNLTHLCVPRPRLDRSRPASFSGLEDVDLERVKMVVITVDLKQEQCTLDELMEAALEEDERFFVVHSPSKRKTAMEEWRKECQGDFSIWEEAMKLRGILPDDYVIEVQRRRYRTPSPPRPTTNQTILERER